MAARRRFKKRASHRRRRANRPVPALLAISLAGIALSIWLIVLASEPAGVPVPKSIPVRAETGLKNPRVAGVNAWAKAISAADEVTLGKHCDYPMLYRHLQMGETYINTNPSDIRARLLQGDASIWFRQFKVSAAEILGLDQNMAVADHGTVMLHLSPKPEHQHKFVGSLDIAVTFAMVSGVARVQDWSIRRMPGRIRQRVERAFHPEIGPAKIIEVVGKDTATEVAIAEPRPMDHLETTAAELRVDIDSLIQDLLDIKGTARSYGNAWEGLVEIGRPAVPRLLNALYSTPMGSQDNLIRLRRVLVVLQKMTGLYFVFDQAALGTNPFDRAAQETRKLAVKSWFGWWTNNFDKPIDAALKAARAADEADGDARQQSPGLPRKRR